MQWTHAREIAHQRRARRPEWTDELVAELERLREHIFASISLGEETPKYWGDWIDRNIEFHESNGNELQAAALRALGNQLEEDFREERQFICVSRRIAYKRVRACCRAIIPRGRRRGRASHRRVGARTAAKATSTGDPDPEPPRPRAPLRLGGAL